MSVWEEIRERIERDDEFATMPHIAAKVMKMVEDPDTTAAKLERFISVDQVLTAEILKLANSPLYAPRVPIASLKHAISYLGMANIRSIALMVAIRSLYSKGKDREIMQAFWKHSAASAVVIKNIVMAVKGLKLNAEEMFTMGLLHDFGKVVLFKYYPDDYRSIVSDVIAGKTDFYSAEKGRFGVSHAEVGAMVLSKWGFPIDVVNAVGSHHGDVENELVALIKLANVFCSSWDFSLVNPQFELEGLERALNVVNMDEDRWREVSQEVKKQIEESAEVLGG